MGGAIQNAANFILLASKDTDNQYIFLLSPQVLELLKKWIPIDERMHCLAHPLHDKNTQLFVSNIEKAFMPDIVYTMAGPTYLKFSVPHVLGISDGYISHAQLHDFFYKRSVNEAILHLGKTFYKALLSRKEGDFFIFQTELARSSYIKRYHLKQYYTYVVHNAIGESFLRHPVNTKIIKHFNDDKKNYNILIPAANYSHKDIDIVYRMAYYFKHNQALLTNSCLKFILTIPEEQNWKSKIMEINSWCPQFQVVNHGPFSYHEAPKLYDNCDLVFIPSILETFSTSYIEALIMRKPLLVADKNFARDICDDAATYFRPKDEKDALAKILSILANNIIPIESNTQRILSNYGTYDIRYRNIIHCLSHCLNHS